MKESIMAAAMMAGNNAAEMIAYRLRDRIRDLIPDKGGWYDLYKASIKVVKLGDDHFEIMTTVAQIKHGDILADSSLIWISGPGAVADILSQSNPWTLDTIPAINGEGLIADMLVKPTNDFEVAKIRSKRLNDLPMVRARINETESQVLDFDSALPEIKGKVTADVPFLTKRLEYGLGGFPRTPIWSRIDYESKLIAGSKDVQEAGQHVFSDRWWKCRGGRVGRDPYTGMK